MTRLKTRESFIFHAWPPPDTHTAVTGSRVQLFLGGQEVRVIGRDAQFETSLVQIPGTDFYRWVPTGNLEETA